MDTKLSYMSLARYVKYLRACGFYRLDESSPKTHRFFHMIYTRAVLAFFLLYTAQQILKIYEVRNNVDKVMDTMFLLLTYTDCIYKGVVLWKKADQIERFLAVMKGPIFNQGVPEHRVFLQDTVRNALLLFRVFNYMALFTCFLWALHPTVLHLRGNPIEFQVWFPFDPNTRFFPSVIYVWLQTSWLAYCNTLTDVFITFSLEQCRTQVSILRFDLENVVQKSKEEAKTSSSSYSSILEKKFYKMLVHHKLIVNTAEEVQNIFGGAVFYQFLVGGWILCTSAYRMVSMSTATIEFVSMAMYMSCILIEICLYCYYGNEITYELFLHPSAEVTHKLAYVYTILDFTPLIISRIIACNRINLSQSSSQSSKLTESAYAMDWLEIPVRQRRNLVIFMERIKKPIQPMAGYLIPLSNSTFVSILRSSYSFYAFLKNSDR